MKYIFNRSAKIFQGDDVTIHFTTGDNGFEIVDFCPSCLEKYMEKTKKIKSGIVWGGVRYMATDEYRKKQKLRKNKLQRKNEKD